MKKLLSIILSVVMIFSLSIPAFAASEKLKTTDAWKCDVAFFATDNVEILKEKGISFRNTGNLTFNDGNIVTSENTVTLNSNGGLGGNYTFETEYKISNSNQHYITFNKIGNSYYKLTLLSGGNNPGTLQLSKVIDGAEAVVLKEVSTAQAATAWWANWAFNIKVSQKLVDDGAAITANLYSLRTKETVVLEYTDTDNAFDFGAATVEFPDAICTLYSLKAYSTPYAEPTLVNKVVADYDGFKGHTMDSLTQRGFTFTNLTYMDMSSTWAKFNNSLGNITFAEPGKTVVEGSYNARFKFEWKWNNHNVTFNRNGSDYYAIVKGSETVDDAAQYYIRIDKVTADGTQTLEKNIYTSNPLGDTYTSRIYDITVNKEVSPAKITAKITNANGVEYVIEATDASPLADGYIKIDCEYSGYPTLYNFFCTKKETVGGTNADGVAGLYTNKDGRLITLDDDCFFYVNDSYADAYSKGKIAVEAPVRRIGNYVVVAALYEDYEMTNIVTLTPEEFNSGRVEIFDTTNSTAKDAYVKVFIFDSEDTLNNCTKVYELN